jgi:hypothetical protein
MSEFAPTVCVVDNIIDDLSFTKMEILSGTDIKMEIEVTSTKALYLGSSLDVMWMASA